MELSLGGPQPNRWFSNKQNSSDLDDHPYRYLSTLNGLFDFSDKHPLTYEQRQQSSTLRRKIKIPSVFYDNYKQQKQQMESFHDKKHLPLETFGDNRRFWREHEQLLSRYNGRSSKENRNINKGKYVYSQEDQERIFQADRKNVFLRKLIKAGKIPNYDKNQLESQVIGKLKRLASGKAREIHTSASCRARPKTHNPNAIPNNASRITQKCLTTKIQQKPDRKSRLTQHGLKEQLYDIFGKQAQPIQYSTQNFESFYHKSANFKKIDHSISSSNINRIRRFIRRVRQLQNNK